jgi:hypothetical protein
MYTYEMYFILAHCRPRLGSKICEGTGLPARGGSVGQTARSLGYRRCVQRWGTSAVEQGVASTLETCMCSLWTGDTKSFSAEIPTYRVVIAGVQHAHQPWQSWQAQESIQPL